MGIQAEIIIKKYQRNKYFFDHLFFPAKKCKRLLVFFSSMGKNRYDRFSWFFDKKEEWDRESACLFIKDDSFHYFLGTPEKPLINSIGRLINEYKEICHIENDHIYTIGGSMGGYAAIYYASFLGLNGAIVANPQISAQATVAHEFDNWEQKIRECAYLFKDLNMFVLKRQKPNLYIEWGDYYADNIAVKCLLDSYRNGDSLVISRKVSWKDHTVDCLSRKSILNAIFFFENSGFVKEKAPRPIDGLGVTVPDSDSDIEFYK